MPYPEGYRKAMRVMDLADRHGFPVVTLVDTPGAFPGLAAEQHGQGGWIARCQLAMIGLDVPSVACVIGEGGSGGAVAIAVADRVLMQENSIYSVISPEGCAAILWRDASAAKKAAAAFKPDARHCLDLGVIDGIVPEPEGGAHADHDAAAALLATASKRRSKRSRARIRAAAPLARRKRFLSMGVFVAYRRTLTHSFHRVIRRPSKVRFLRKQALIAQGCPPAWKTFRGRRERRPRIPTPPDRH